MSVEKKSKVNADLQRERKNCTFNTEEFTNWWYGSEKNVQEKRFTDKMLLENPELEDKVPLYYLSHKEVYEQTMRKLAVTVKKVRELKEKDGGDYLFAPLTKMTANGITTHGNILSVHYGMFVPTITGQGTDEQQAEWLQRAKDLSIIGTYAQTELGHGTFVRGIETTATYDPETQEFVLNSPTLSSYKWWPGGLAHSANHCILMAQLITQGESKGVFAFIIQIRDTETHMPLPGVKVGEIGAKLGMNSVNNGFLGFDNVRVPRKALLMRNAQVLADGTFVKANSANVLTYGTMVFVRVHIVGDTSTWLAQAATIAIRYSAVRKQSKINADEGEVQIMDHLTQQYKLFPQLAKSVVFKLSANYIWDMYTQVTAELEKGQLERLPEMHALSCCLKAVTTTDASEGFETCRMACGGHGYLASSNFNILYGMLTAAATYEGETTVMLLQTARFLIKAWNLALRGKSLTPTVAYLAKVKNGKTPAFNRSIPGIVQAFQFASGKMIQIANEKIEAKKKTGMSHEEAVNGASIELARAAEMHCRAFLIESGYLSITELVKNMSRELGKVLLDLIELYAVDSVLRNMAHLLRFVNISEDDVANIQGRLESALGRIRLNAVGIVDSFDFPDKLLSSTLGSYDGNVYERLFEEAMKSPLNQEPVNKSFELYLKPLMKQSKL